MAYAGDFSLGQLVFHGLISVTHVRGLYEGMRAWIQLEGIVGDGLASLLSIYVITAIIRFYSTLILGVSPFQWFLGIKNSARGLSVRFSAAARVALEIPLLPLIVPMLPVLFERASLPEALSGARLEKGAGLRGFFGLLGRPLVLAFIFLSFFAPLLRNLAVIEGVHVAFAQIPPAKVDAGVDFTKFKFFPSRFFDFTTFGNLDGERFLLLPQFEVTKDGAQTRIRPFLGIYDRKNNALGFLKKEAQIDWIGLVQLAQRGNPFFNSSYPFLAGELSSKQNFSDQALSELEELVIAALELSFENVFNHVAKHGPFLSGYVDLRQALLGLLDAGAKVQADNMNLGDRRFLRFRQLFDEVPSIEKKYREILIPLGSTQGTILRYEWDASIEGAVTRRDFASAFFAQVQWQKARETFPLKEEMTSLAIIDYLLDESLSAPQRKQLHQFIYDWFWQVARKGIKDQDKTLTTWLSLSMNRIYLVTSGRPALEELGKKILLMRHALEEQNKNFFGLNKE